MHDRRGPPPRDPVGTGTRSRLAPGFVIPADLADRLRGMESTTSLALLSAGLLALVGVAAATRSTSHLAVSAALVAVCAALLACSLLVRGRFAMVGAVVAIATIAVFSAATLELTPTVVWLFAFVVPVVGLVHGARLGALAGAMSAPALHWIETGVAIDPIGLFVELRASG